MIITRLKPIIPVALLALIGTTPALRSQSDPAPNQGDYLEILDESLPESLSWSSDDQGSLRPDGGYNSESYLYVGGTQSPATITGLNIRIRENPDEGEYRFFSFAWRRWGDGTVAIQLERDPSQDGENRRGATFDYTFDGGSGPATGGKALRVSDSVGGGWQPVTSDLWKDFGDFTITGIKLISNTRDAGFDAIAFARTEEDLGNFAPILQARVTEGVEVETPEDSGISASSAGEPSDEVKVDWAAQIAAGGIWMYPLYLCALAAIVISVQRLLTVREEKLAPRPLQQTVRTLINEGHYEQAAKTCENNPSTLAACIHFILKHRHAGMETVSQTAGDIAARDIRGHLARIYPLSLISSIAPLLGLLGTIIGMVEAFGIVALYGDEGGASILSDSISKALITTATGLIIAIPCVAIYFILKNRIMTLASVIEVEVEELITKLYLKNPD